MVNNKIVKTELKALRSRSLSIQVDLVKALEKGFQGRHLYRVRPLDAQRLLVLETWMERYRVDLPYILGVLIPHWSKRFRKGGRQKRKGLGCRVTTLAGRKSEEILREQIEKDFPQGENVTQWKEDAREEELDPAEDVVTRRKGMLDVTDPTVYVKAYLNRVQRKQKKKVKASASITRRRRTYRGNPWL